MVIHDHGHIVAKRRHSRQKGSPYRPRLELLEGRCLPSTVTNLNDAGAGSLRQAIVDTPSGGTVDFQPGLAGTITLTTGELLINKDLTITGPGADVITVSGNHASRVVEVTGIFTVAISGLTIADGQLTSAQVGGGILNAGTLTVTASTITGNVAVYGGGGIANVGTLTVTGSNLRGNAVGTSGEGGGIYNVGTLTLTASSLSGNSAAFGGAICSYSAGTLTVTTSTLTDNAAVAGGGIDNLQGALTVNASTFIGNYAMDGPGGGIHNAGTLTVSASTFVDNSAGGGGAINNDTFGTATITASTITGNAAAYSGGGISNFGTVTVTASTVSRNVAVYGGGIGIYQGTLTVLDSTVSDNATTNGPGGGISNFGTLTVTNSTLSGNAATDGPGGGIANDFTGRVTVIDSTIRDNAASQGGGVSNSGPQAVIHARNTILADNTAALSSDVLGDLTSLGHNLIGNGSGGTGYDATDLVGTLTNPIDPLLGPLADNGGSTQTMALLPGSPAIGAGDAADVPEFDQRGLGFDRIVNGQVDIGAFEVQLSPINGPFDAFSLPPCDNCSSDAVPLGFTFDFLGVREDTVWVNNNGNLSFGRPFNGFIPEPLSQVGQPILAPFWADVSTNSGLGRVTYGQGTLDGDPAFGATWENVGGFGVSGTNYFQIVIVDHSARLGYTEIQFNYRSIQWDHPTSSDAPPRAGYSNGAGSSLELPGSGTFDVMLDNGTQSLRVLRRYTVIVYPTDSGGGPLSGFRDVPAKLPASVPVDPFAEWGSNQESHLRASTEGLSCALVSAALPIAEPPSIALHQGEGNVLIPNLLPGDERWAIL